MPQSIAISEFEIPPTTRSLRVFRTTLKKQGLIEPLVLDAAMEFSENWYDTYYLQAAHELGWPTILVTWPGE